MELLAALITLLLWVAIYVTPIIIAMARKHPNTAPIAVITIFTGWTGIGWVVCLAWSLTNGKYVDSDTKNP